MGALRSADEVLSGCPVPVARLPLPTRLGPVRRPPAGPDLPDDPRRWDHLPIQADPAEELVRAGRRALADAEWGSARSLFERALERAQSAEALDGLSQALYFAGEHLHAIELKERAFAAYRRAGRPEEAADVAGWLAFLHGAVHGNRAAADGWMAWAERLLDGRPESLAHARAALGRAPWTQDPDERARHATVALEIARRLGDRDLEFTAQALLGHAHVVRGRVAEGMALLDEAMAAVSAREVASVEAIGEIYCRMLGACERSIDVRRAEQWTSEARRFVAWGEFVAPTCRLHYGGILTAVGRWAEAEDELLAAARVLEAGHRGMRAAPLVRLAALRVRQGRLEEAERLLDGFEARAEARQVLAAIALARGDLALAGDLARLCLEGEDDAGAACVPLLELLVAVHVARGDLHAAAEARDRLVAIAASSRSARARAAAELAVGRVAAAEGDGRARSHLKAAVEAFDALELPLETAQAQLELARALSVTAPAGAVAEARAALSAFERLGAARDADAAASLLRSLGVRSPRVGPRSVSVLTARERDVLELVALGLSNPEIAERLYLSRKTVQHHVSRVLGKLGLGSRAEAAAYAARELGVPAAGRASE